MGYARNTGNHLIVTLSAMGTDALRVTLSSRRLTPQNAIFSSSVPARMDVETTGEGLPCSFLGMDSL